VPDQDSQSGEEEEELKSKSKPNLEQTPPEPEPEPVTPDDFFVDCTLCKEPFPDMYIKLVNNKPFCDKCHAKVMAAAQAKRTQQLRQQQQQQQEEQEQQLENHEQPQAFQPTAQQSQVFQAPSMPSGRAQPRVRAAPPNPQPAVEEGGAGAGASNSGDEEAGATCFACRQKFSADVMLSLQNKMFCAKCYAQVIQKAKDKGVLNKILN
jgi:hypothetical protein